MTGTTAVSNSSKQVGNMNWDDDPKKDGWTVPVRAADSTGTGTNTSNVRLITRN